MKLNDFDNKPVATATKALKQHFELPFQVEGMSMPITQTMLRKVRGLMSETKQQPKFYQSQNNASYMKLVFMEQALSQHYSELRSRPQARIVVENEEVEKSQTILAAQDMVDSIQKMVEQVSDMIVKELPALVDSVQSEIGVNESSSFQQQASEALTSLQAALTQSQTTMKSAVNGITGQGGTDAFDDESGMGGDLAAPMPGEEEIDMDASFDDDNSDIEVSADIEEPETPAVGPVGRAKR
jgi:hypothetical protein